MLTKIREFLDNPKYTLLITLIVLLMAFFIFYINFGKCDTYENFDDLKPCVSKTDDIFNKTYAKSKKLVNLKCNINGTKYYLAIMSEKNCVPETATIKCPDYGLVLINETNMGEMLEKYKKNFTIAKKLCNVEKKMTCETKISESKTEEEKMSESKTVEEKCPDEYVDCEFVPRYIHDFEITEFYLPSNDNPTSRKYVIKGINKPNLNFDNNVVKISKDIYTDTKGKFACATATSVIDDVSLMIIEKEMPLTGGILSISEPIVNFQIYFEVPTIENGVPIYQNGVIKMKKIFMCLSDERCKNTDGEFLRVSFTDNKDDAAIINFEPFFS